MREGRLTTESTSYCGVFENWLLTGPGELIDAKTQSLTKGTFVAGQLEGHAVRTWTHNTKEWELSGNYKSGLLDGFAKLKTEG